MPRKERVGRERRIASSMRGFLAVLAVAWIAAFPRVGAAGGAEAMQRVLAGDCKGAGDEINEGIARNDPAAFMVAGYLYDVTGCVEHDPARAARYYRRAVDLGDPEAANFLGFMYGLGSGVPQDYREAYRNFILGSQKDPEFKATSEEHEPAAGYALTVTQLARTKANLANPRVFGDATVMVTFHVATRSVDFDVSAVYFAYRSAYRRQIIDAYTEAMKVAPDLDPAFKQDVDFLVPWKFVAR